MSSSSSIGPRQKAVGTETIGWTYTIGCHRSITPSVVRSENHLFINFKCFSSQDDVDPSYVDTYNEIVNGTIYRRFTVEKVCTPNEHTGKCGSKRGHLWECRCDTFKRKAYPDKRGKYEDIVINKVLDIFDEQILCCTPDGPEFPPKKINIAIFACGGLHGELTLLVRLIDKLKKTQLEYGQKYKIRIFLIDLLYESCIKDAYGFTTSPCKPCAFIWNKFIGEQLDLNQFLEEISKALPSSISVKGSVFADKDHYLKTVSQKASYKHDLLIGSDINDTLPLFKEIQSQASKWGENGILLHWSKEAGGVVRSIICKVSSKAECQYIEDDAPKTSGTGGSRDSRGREMRNKAPPQASGSCVIA